MKIFYLIICLAAIAQTAPAADSAKPNTIASWHFDGNGNDAAGHYNLKLRGKDTHYVNDGKTGGALMLEGNMQAGDKKQGASAKNTSDINPKSAFTLEMWISPGKQLAGEKYAFLLDKRYYYYYSDVSKGNTGYLLALRQSEGNQFFLEAQLGFGSDSAMVRSEPQSFETDQWYHIAFTYDGKGLCTFYLNSERIGQTQLKGVSGVTPSDYPLVIGDRAGRIQMRFCGKIDEVRILNKDIKFTSGKVLLNIADSRTAFYRMEKDTSFKVEVFNDRQLPLTNASLQISAPGVINKTLPVPNLAPGKSTFITVPFDANLRSAIYHVTANIKGTSNQDNTTFPLTIVPRRLPHQMPVIIWGYANSPYEEVTDLGFTDEFVNVPRYGHFMTEYGRFMRDSADTSLRADVTQGLRQRINEMTAAQLGSIVTLNPGQAITSLHPEFKRKGRMGEVIDNTDGLYPAVEQFVQNTGAAAANAFGDLPGWRGVLMHSEIRDRTAPSFNEIDKSTYRKFSGQDIPAQIFAARGINYRTLPDFPASRIISDDDPILTYYKWFWKNGDGWNTLNSLLNDGLKSTERKDVLTWYDPALRAPSIWGSGGNVDYLDQWTYTYPNPMKTDLAVNELFAMANGRPGQKVMNMIQIIWYRSHTTDKPIKGHEAEWEKVSPKAKFITIAPDHLSEATWLELSYPVDAIANHGWGSRGDHLGSSQRSYVTTNTETRKRLKDLLQNVVKPLAPTLMQVPDHKTDVAFLESFASQMFAGTGSYGWGTGWNASNYIWSADAYSIARYAGLQPKIVYDETIQQKGLGQYKVLFLNDCPVLTQSVAEAIKKFQQRGGIVIGDEDLAPGIQPDILLSKIKRGEPKESKQLLQKKATELLNELAPFYQPFIESSNPDVITRLRRFGDSQYIFTINDNRTYGGYVGQYKKVMENGLPSQAQITLNSKSNGAIYDLNHHRQVNSNKAAHDKLQFDVNLDAGEGNLFLATSKPIGTLQITAPSNVERGKSLPIKVLLPDSAGETLHAVIPLNITIRDPEGRIAEQSGYYGASNGTLELNLDIASNDAAGKWQISAVEALTGQEKTLTFVVSE